MRHLDSRQERTLHETAFPSSIAPRWENSSIPDVLLSEEHREQGSPEGTSLTVVESRHQLMHVEATVDNNFELFEAQRVEEVKVNSVVCLGVSRKRFRWAGGSTLSGVSRSVLDTWHPAMRVPGKTGCSLRTRLGSIHSSRLFSCACGTGEGR